MASTSTSHSDRLDIHVLVMGPTDSGKTTFMNLLSNSELSVSDAFQPCTTEVEVSTKLELDGRMMTLVNVPGFDDILTSDVDMLRRIATDLVAMYKNGQRLKGILYFHRIPDSHTDRVARRNFELFLNLCGETSLRNVIIVTNAGREADRSVTTSGRPTEQEYHADKDLFRPAIGKGAEILRHDGNIRSAQKILRHVILNKSRSIRIQREIIDAKYSLEKTAAGKMLGNDIDQLLAKYERELEDIKTSLKKAGADKNKQLQQELQESHWQLTQRMEQARKSRSSLSRQLEESTNLPGHDPPPTAKDTTRQASRHGRPVGLHAPSNAATRAIDIPGRRLVHSRDIDDVWPSNGMLSPYSDSVDLSSSYGSSHSPSTRPPSRARTATPIHPSSHLLPPMPIGRSRSAGPMFPDSMDGVPNMVARSFDERYLAPVDPTSSAARHGKHTSERGRKLQKTPPHSLSATKIETAQEHAEIDATLSIHLNAPAPVNLAETTRTGHASCDGEDTAIAELVQIVTAQSRAMKQAGKVLSSQLDRIIAQRD